MPVYGHSSFATDVRYVIHEAYVGKTETLLEAEDAINQIRVNCKKYQDINKSPEVQRLNRLIEKQFGMEVFALQVSQSSMIDAYSIPIDTRFDVGLEKDISKYVTGDIKTGYKFKSDNGFGIICCFSLGLLRYTELTDAEIIAIILHEVGHNFSAAIYDKVKAANKKWVDECYKWLVQNAVSKKALEKNLYSNSSQKVKDEANKKSKKSTGIANGIAATFGNIKDFIKIVASRLGPTAFLYKIFFRKMSSKERDKYKKETENSARRADEIIADKFAGVYGYGPEQVSALMKLDKWQSTGEKFVDKIPFIGKVLNANYLDAINDGYIFDEHPQIIQRAFEEIKLLEAELAKSDVDPKLKKIMEAQIEQMKSLVAEAIKITDDGKKIDQIRAAFYAYIANNDPKSVSDDIEKDINDAMDKMLKKKK